MSFRYEPHEFTAILVRDLVIAGLLILTIIALASIAHHIGWVS